jgi:hypothetical protein
VEPVNAASYTPSDGSDSVGAYLDSIGATHPLAGSMEKDLLEGSR